MIECNKEERIKSLEDHHTDSVEKLTKIFGVLEVQTELLKEANRKLDYTNGKVRGLVTFKYLIIVSTLAFFVALYTFISMWDSGLIQAIRFMSLLIYSIPCYRQAPISCALIKKAPFFKPSRPHKRRLCRTAASVPGRRWGRWCSRR